MKFEKIDFGYEVIEATKSDYLHCCEEVEESLVTKIWEFLQRKNTWPCIENLCKEIGEILEVMFGGTNGKAAYPNGDGLDRDNMLKERHAEDMTISNRMKQELEERNFSFNEEAFFNLPLYFWVWLHLYHLDLLQEEIIDITPYEQYCETKLTIDNEKTWNRLCDQIMDQPGLRSEVPVAKV